MSTIQLTQALDAFETTLAARPDTGTVADRYIVQLSSVPDPNLAQSQSEKGSLIVFDPLSGEAKARVSNWVSRTGGTLLNAEIAPIGATTLDSLSAGDLVRSALSSADWRDLGDTLNTMAETISFGFVQSCADGARIQAAAYTDSAGAAVLTSAKSYADVGAAGALASAKTYAASGAEVALASAKSYADAATATVLGAAKSYTDQHATNEHVVYSIFRRMALQQGR